MIIPALTRAGYQCEMQKYIGIRLGGRRHRVDALVTDRDNHQILVSLKWQQSSGTAEQKVPFEVLCLIEAVRTSSDFDKAYLVLGGTGWTLREFYTRELENYLKHREYVDIELIQTFCANK